MQITTSGLHTQRDLEEEIYYFMWKIRTVEIIHKFIMEVKNIVFRLKVQREFN